MKPALVHTFTRLRVSDSGLIHFNCFCTHFSRAYLLYAHIALIPDQNSNRNANEFVTLEKSCIAHFQASSLKPRRWIWNTLKLKCASRNRVANVEQKAFEYIMIENDTRPTPWTVEEETFFFSVSFVSSLPICRHSVCTITLCVCEWRDQQWWREAGRPVKQQKRTECSFNLNKWSCRESI